jgi:hypothetical protein
MTAASGTLESCRPYWRRATQPVVIAIVRSFCVAWSADLNATKCDGSPFKVREFILYEALVWAPESCFKPAPSTGKPDNEHVRDDPKHTSPPAISGDFRFAAWS